MGPRPLSDGRTEPNGASPYALCTRPRRGERRERSRLAMLRRSLQSSASSLASALAARAADSLAILPGDFTLAGPAARQTIARRDASAAARGRRADGRHRLHVERSGGRQDRRRRRHPRRQRPGDDHGHGGGRRATIEGHRHGHRTSRSRGASATTSSRSSPRRVQQRAPATGRRPARTGSSSRSAATTTRAITDDHAARRSAGGSNPADPARSLLLPKPTTAVPHKGGVRFEADSREYRILSATGSPPGARAQAGRPAHPADRGPARRTYPQARGDAAVPRPRTLQRRHGPRTSPAGRSTRPATRPSRDRRRGQGQGRWATARGRSSPGTCSQIATATVTVPYRDAVDAGRVRHGRPRRNFIDELVLAKLQSLNLPPSPRCSDAEFIRRAYLDTIGTLPTADEVAGVPRRPVAGQARPR